MNEDTATHGLTCPKCGGVISIPEGQPVVRCPYCDLRSFVRGARGLRRYQVPQQLKREASLSLLRQFFRSNWAIARDAPSRSQLTEAFLVYLPFWTVWGRAAAWAFGQKKVGSGDHQRYEPREVRIVQEMTWNGAACDVGEFGVDHVPLTDQALGAFNPDELHQAGMIFEPVSSFGEARSSAEHQFQEQVRRRAGLDRISQLFVRFFRLRTGLVYYPLWVLRYLYRGRAFQVVVDGNSGKVLYGKAPGNVLFRAAVLVAGMAAGAFLAVDIPSLILSQVHGNNSEGALGFALFIFLAGLACMGFAYRTFRYGEQYEYRSGPKTLAGIENPFTMLPGGGGNLSSIKLEDIEHWINLLN